MSQLTLNKQAQEFEVIEKNWNSYEVVLLDRVIAQIVHDASDFTTQAWVVEINGEEVHRAATVAKCENWVIWHYKQGTLPVHDEWVTAQEEFLDHIEEQVNEIAPEPVELPATEVKVARQLKIGDKVVLDGEIWKLERINIQPVQYQSWHSEVHGVRFHLTLLPNDYQYRPYPMSVGQAIDWNDAADHECREAERFVTTAKYLSPCGEAEFDVVMKAVLPKPEMTPSIKVGYDLCLANNIQFKQRTGESGTIYWYGVAPTYYGQPGRQYRTIGFPDLKNTIKAALEYLIKCNVLWAAEVKRQMGEEALAPQEPVSRAIRIVGVHGRPIQGDHSRTLSPR